MEYFKILNLTREPFSNSPEPEFFYESPHHVGCLQKLELAIRIRRGLNVVIGEVGTGKTTLSRQLIRKFASDEEVTTYLLLDPHFSAEHEFLKTIAQMFGLVNENESVMTGWQLRERIKKYLFEEAVEKSKIVVLIIDEGQKIPDFCLEILREFLNFETNEYKLLQIVIFAQEEFRDTLTKNPGFADRVNLSYTLGPLNFKDTKAMVVFRIMQAMEKGRKIPVQFTGPAMREIYKATGGYPRKIVKLCHQILLTLIIQNKKKAGRSLVRSVAQRVATGNYSRGVSWVKSASLAALIIVFLFIVFEREYLDRVIKNQTAAPNSALTEKKIEASFDRPSILSSPVKAPADGNNAHADSAPPDHLRQSHTAKKTEQVLPLPAGVNPASHSTGANPELFPAAKEKHTAAEPSVGISQSVAEPPVVKTETASLPASYPAILGQLKVTQDKIVWRMIEEIYGASNVRMLRRVAEVNSHIANLDNVVAGDTVKFPSIPAESDSAINNGFYKVEISRAENLKEIYETYRKYRKRIPESKIVSCWNEEDGLQFYLLLKESFSGEAAARQKMESLPQDIAVNAKIRSKWKKGTVFFAAREEKEKLKRQNSNVS